MSDTPLCDLEDSKLYRARDELDDSEWLLWWDDDTLVSIRLDAPLEILAWDGGVVRSLEEDGEEKAPFVDVELWPQDRSAVLPAPNALK